MPLETSDHATRLRVGSLVARRGSLVARRSSLVARRHQVLRYAAVSAISTLTSLTVLGLLVGLVGVGAVAANLAATAAGTMPSFELNRRWVWSRAGRRSVGREVAPFCALSFAGLLISTVTVRAASTLSAHTGPLLHTGAVELANVGAYGSLWVLQFVLLDRVLFARTRVHPDRDLVAPCDSAARSAEHV